MSESSKKWVVRTADGSSTLQELLNTLEEERYELFMITEVTRGVFTVTARKRGI